MKERIAILFVLSILFVSCVKNQNKPTGTFLSGNGVFILNEGNFIGGAGSLSFYSYDSAKIYNDLFENVNGWPIGSVPNSMKLKDVNGYIVVNNSNKIEVINKNTLESVKTITRLNSPRNISFVDNEKAYVTSEYSDSVVIINLSENTISGYINLRRFSEAIVTSGGKSFITNWVGPYYASGKEVMVVNNSTNQIVDSIEVGYEPESIVVDKNNMVWVLCNGGYSRNNYAELIGINSSTNKIEKRLAFSTKQESPTCLQIDGTGETLYFLDGGVRKMKITDSALPAAPLIAESGHSFYKLGINPVNSDIFVTDAVDYQQKGYVLYYKKDGTFISSQIADIIPSSMCFKLN